MANLSGADITRWYVMHSYKNEKKAEEKLQEYGQMRFFIPTERAVRTRNGKKIVIMVPVIPSLVFVQASQKQIVNFKKSVYNDLQFVIWREHDGKTVRYLTVDNRDMQNFIQLYEHGDKNLTFYRPGEIDIRKGVRVRVHCNGGLDQLEGIFVKVARKRSKQIVVIIPDTLAISAEVEPEVLEVIG